MRVLLAVVSLIASAQISPGQVASVQKQPDLHKDVQSMPRVLANADVPAAIAAKINASLDRFNAQVAGDVRDCLKGNSPVLDYSRTVAVTMHGPAYLSMTAEDGFDCGGPHTENDEVVLVYDLKTGSPVNWVALLPPQATGEIIRSRGRLSIGVVHWAAMLQRVKSQVKEKECATAYNDKSIAFNVWLSAKDHAIVLSPIMGSHIDSALCTEQVLLKPDEAKRLGVAQPLLDALRDAK